MQARTGSLIPDPHEPSAGTDRVHGRHPALGLPYAPRFRARGRRRLVIKWLNSRVPAQSAAPWPDGDRA